VTPKRITALFIAGRHLFAGAVEHGSNRILDVLNDANAEMLRIHGVEIFRQSIGEPIAQLKEAVIPKSAVDCVLLYGDSHEAPLRRQYALVNKQPRTVFVVLTEHAIHGTLMVKGSGDPALVLMHAAPTFFPIVEPILSGVGATNATIPARVALVNKTKVSLIQIERHKLSSSSFNQEPLTT
jgi:hypothetical protein